MDRKHPKVLLIGLDGATWDVLDKFIKAGNLPTLKRIRDNGIWGDLQSTIPPISPCAWVSLATGKNPGKTGVIDFFIKKEKSYDFNIISSNDYKGKSFWDYLSEDGRKIGIVNYPFLFPPYKINGFIIPGVFGNPFSDNFTYPKELINKINELTDGYKVIVNYHNLKYNDEDLFLKDINLVFDERVKVIKHLMQEKEWDLFIAIFTSTDYLQHFMWKHIDKSHSLHNKNSSRYKIEFLRFWRKVDKVIDELIKIAGEEIITIIVSDHGFGSNNKCFNLSKWLEIKGYLKRKDIYSNVIDDREKIIILPQRSQESTDENLINQIDFKRTKAYPASQSVVLGAIYINLRKREPEGIIDEEESKILKKKIVKELKNLKRDVGYDIKVETFYPERIYDGKYVSNLPDIVFIIDGGGCIIKKDFYSPVFEKNSFSNRHTGSHRINGVFLMYKKILKLVRD